MKKQQRPLHTATEGEGDTMIKTFLTKTTAFLLCLTLLYGLTGYGLLPKFPGFPEPNPTTPSEPETTAPSESTFPVNQDPSVSVPHFDVPLEERSRNSFDSAAYDSAYQEFAALLESDGNAERIGELYEIINDLLQDSKTDAALALYDYDQDVSNGELAERYSSMQSSYSSVYSKSVQLFRSVFSTAYADTLRMQIGDVLADKFEAAATVTEEENALKARIQELERTYDTLARQGADSLPSRSCTSSLSTPITPTPACAGMKTMQAMPIPRERGGIIPLRTSGGLKARSSPASFPSIAPMSEWSPRMLFMTHIKKTMTAAK